MWKDIFEYHNHFNQKMIAEIIKHFGALPERTFPLFCHVLNAHQIWNSRILGLKSYEINQVHPKEKCSEIDANNYLDTLKILASGNLDREINYKTFKGADLSNKISDILFHIVNHSTHHKAQIISDFRRRNIEPLATDYILWKMTH